MKPIPTIIAFCSWFTLLVLPFNSMGQQPWMNKIRDPKNANFYQTQQAFNNYWKGQQPEGKGKIPRGRGYKPYKRWEWFWEPRVGREGIFPSASVVMEEWEKY